MRSERLALPILVLALASCASDVRRFPLRQPMWRDPDARPFGPAPEEYESPFAWDAADQTIFRPVARFFAVDPAGRAINVNAMDEVPDSSWFENRIGRRPMTPEEAALGACTGVPPLDPSGPWTVSGAKPNGANPGFIIEDAQGRRFLLKFDGTDQPERATSADVIGAAIYHDAGYHAPCNSIVFFDRGVLRIGEDAEAEDAHGRDVPLTMRHIDTVLAKGLRLRDGRYRASASLFVEGRPIGPWTYQGTRDDDPNDVVAHEDRRELRGGYVIASWINHFDAREQNTLATFVETGGAGRGRGYVKHYMLDFGDSLGSLWEYDGISRRLGHAYYLDIPYMLEDFATLGAVERPWDRARHGRAGAALGYFDATDFDPEEWRSGYPNPAFVRMQEADAAWMARILARFEDAHVRAIVARAEIQDPVVERELVRILIARRDEVLRRWLGVLSPLADPELRATTFGAALCLDDLALRAGLVAPRGRRYRIGASIGREELTRVLVARPTARNGEVCVPLPAASDASPSHPAYLVVSITAHGRDRREVLPARAHLYHLGGSEYRIVGLERPE